MGETTDSEQKSYGDNEYKVLIYQCIKCYGYTDHVIDDICPWCACHPWTWDLTLGKKKKRMVTASW